MSTRTIATLLTVPLVTLMACQGERTAEEMAEQQPAAEETMEMAAATYELEITNPMPHAMVVYRKTLDEEVRLGTVPANGSTYFTITEPTDMEVRLRAEDEAQTHEVTGKVHLQEGMDAAWTIGADAKPAEKKSETERSDG